MGNSSWVGSQKSIPVYFAWCCEVSGGSLTACLGRAFADFDATCGCMVCCLARPLFGIVDLKK